MVQYTYKYRSKGLNETKQLLKYMKGYTAECILAPTFKMIEAAFELAVPLIIASIIDVGIETGDRHYIVTRCLLLALLALVGLAASLTAQYFAAGAATGFSSAVRYKLMDKIMSMPHSELDNIGSSTLITRMTGDIEQLQSGVNLALRLLLRSPFVVFGAMIMAFTVDSRSALIFAVLIPLLCVIVFGIMLYTIPLYKKVQSGVDRVTSCVRSNIHGRRVIRAFCREDGESEKFASANDALTKLQKFAGGISAIMNPFTLLLVNFAIVALLYTGGVRVDSGELSEGDVVALYNYMTQILVELIKMANLIITMTRAAACGERIGRIIGADCEMKITENCPVGEKEYAVKLDNVTFTYEGAGRPSLENISLSVKRGETIGIIGGTGSGKSTLVDLIPRFYDATSGNVFVNGINVKSIPEKQLREKIGFVPQHAALFSGTIRDNLLFGNQDASEEEIRRAIEVSQSTDIVENKEGGLDCLLGENGSGLSGGQKQRLTIARALVREPEILILDDSASALDYTTDARLRRAIRENTEDMTVFIVSQRVNSVMSADRILVLDDGKIVGEGSHSFLLENCGIYREIYSSQTKEA